MALAFNKVPLNAATYVCLNPSNAANAAVTLLLEIPLGEFAWVAATGSNTPPTDDNSSMLLGSQLGGFGHEGTIAELFRGSSATFLHAKLTSGATYTGKAGIGCD